MIHSGKSARTRTAVAVPRSKSPPRARAAARVGPLGILACCMLTAFACGRAVRQTPAPDALPGEATPSVAVDPDAVCDDLSIAQQQVVEIAKALSLESRILVMDEPSATLTPQEVERLFAVIRDLRAQGIGIIYISHRIDEIFQIADRRGRRCHAVHRLRARLPRAHQGSAFSELAQTVVSARRSQALIASSSAASVSLSIVWSRSTRHSCTRARAVDFRTLTIAASTFASWFSICASTPSTQLVIVIVQRFTRFMGNLLCLVEQGACQFEKH